MNTIVNGSVLYSHQVLAIVQKKWFNEKSINRQKTLAYIFLCGFAGWDNEMIYLEAFADQMVIALNNGVNEVKIKELRGSPKSLNKNYTKSIIQKSKVVLEKPLLVVEGNRRYVDYNKMKKQGVTCKQVSTDQYMEMKKNNELSNYCLLYLLHIPYVEIGIWDLGAKDIVYFESYNLPPHNQYSYNIFEIKRRWEK